MVGSSIVSWTFGGVNCSGGGTAEPVVVVRKRFAIISTGIIFCGWTANRGSAVGWLPDALALSLLPGDSSCSEGIPLPRSSYHYPTNVVDESGIFESIMRVGCEPMLIVMCERSTTGCEPKETNEHGTCDCPILNPTATAPTITVKRFCTSA